MQEWGERVGLTWGKWGKRGGESGEREGVERERVESGDREREREVVRVK